MTSTPDRLRNGFRVGVVLVALASAQACGLERPPDPPPFDCATIDRAAERFPEECGEPVDAGEEVDAGEPVDGSDEVDAP
jgi:hypothetical protein